MKRRFKEKHKSTSREDEGGNTGDEAAKEASDLTTPQTSSPEEHRSDTGEHRSEERKSQESLAATGSTEDATETVKKQLRELKSSFRAKRPAPVKKKMCSRKIQLYPFSSSIFLSSEFENPEPLNLSCPSHLITSLPETGPSLPAQSLTPCAENLTETLAASQSSADMGSSSSLEQFTPDIRADGDDETFRLQVSCPGVYQCSVTGLVFDMEAGGDVLYRTVPWDRSLLVQHHKKPAGPLFDITCQQQSVRRLHLPHCEIRSTGGCDFLSVAHVSDGGVEFIGPHRITETHVVINVSGFSAYGNVKDEDSPPVPVQARVLLFYRPPTDPHPESFLSVLLLPANVVLREVQRSRRRSVGAEIYLPVSPHCKLQPNRFYRLFTRPQDDSVKVQPRTAEFDDQLCGNYFTSFEVILSKTLRKLTLSLKHRRNFKTLWRRCVYLKSDEQPALNLRPNKKLLKVRSRFVDAVSEPALKGLLDKLLEKRLLTDSEQEEINQQQTTRADKARFLIDTMRRKGDTASSEMIHCFHEVDPFLCQHLGLQQDC
ncbi:caspase recruitment domain-containing protein 8-like [Betta splendens]|uniref:Caspase recruitment domain-containing protein 8-like n=1 Tax=Betta splendens TaxID=158456 RepID=A0A6P7M793_BETSP|nr:caspase recruitment domain-containing protein 8-like [Betta splendens]XP_040926260.1 caspase recruitment domain-containing protein 8-like [Betta splendens]